jgi:hypothetical protein
MIELLGSIVGLVVLVMWVIRQIVEANKQAGPPKGQPQPAPQQPAQPQPPQGPQRAGQQADPLRNQVEEFLRRAGRARGGDQPAPRRVRPAGASEIEVLIDEDRAPPERRPLAEPLRPVEQMPAGRPRQMPAAPRKARPAREPAVSHRETVAEHVAENVTAHSRALGEQTSRLGQRIIEDDHQFDVQLKAKFDHSVGTLTGSDVADAARAAAVADDALRPAAQIATLLASPDGMRQAMILNEILRRPSDRW